MTSTPQTFHELSILQLSFAILTGNCNCDLTGGLVASMINCVVYSGVRRCLLIFKLKCITLFVCTRQGGNPCVHDCHIVRHTYQGRKCYRSIRLSRLCGHSNVIWACNARILTICIEKSQERFSSPKSSVGINRSGHFSLLKSPSTLSDGKLATSLSTQILSSQNFQKVKFC